MCGVHFKSINNSRELPFKVSKPKSPPSFAGRKCCDKSCVFCACTYMSFPSTHHHTNLLERYRQIVVAWICFCPIYVQCRFFWRSKILYGDTSQIIIIPFSQLSPHMQGVLKQTGVLQRDGTHWFELIKPYSTRCCQGLTIMCNFLSIAEFSFSIRLRPKHCVS